MTGAVGVLVVPVVVGLGAGEADFDRDAISTVDTLIPLKDVVPPGRYWPGGEAIRTVATAAGFALNVLVCGPAGETAAGVVGIVAGKADGVVGATGVLLVGGVAA